MGHECSEANAGEIRPPARGVYGKSWVRMCPLPPPSFGSVDSRVFVGIRGGELDISYSNDGCVFPFRLTSVQNRA
jgi:hypothetical protein